MTVATAIVLRVGVLLGAAVPATWLGWRYVVGVFVGGAVALVGVWRAA